MTPSKVNAALRVFVAGLDQLPEIKPEGVVSRSSKDGPFTIVSFIPAPIETPFIFQDSPQRLTGIFQVTLNYIWGSGTKDIEEMVDYVLSSFKRGTSLVHDGVSVLILRSWRGPLLVDGSWQKIPVSVAFQSHLQP